MFVMKVGVLVTQVRALVMKDEVLLVWTATIVPALVNVPMTILT